MHPRSFLPALLAAVLMPGSSVLAAAVSITVAPSVPADAIVENPAAQPQGNVRIADGHRVGQSFSLPAEADLTGFMLRIDESAASTDLAGALTLEVLPAMDNHAWLEAVFSGSGSLPSGLSSGDLLRIALPEPL